MLKKEIYYVNMMLECNLKLVCGVLLFLNASKSTHKSTSKSTHKSTHGTRLCGVAQGLHIAIVFVNLHTAQDFVE